MTMLLPSEQVSGTPQLQIERGDAEARAQLAEFPDGCQAPPGNLSQRFIRRNQEVGVSTTVRTTDPPSQLVKLGKTITVGSVDDQGVRQRDVEAVFDDRGRHQNIELVMHESRHHLFEFFLAHLTMSHTNAR